MHYRVLACDVLTREICWCAARSTNTLDIAFFAKGEHNHPSRLRDLLQQQIDEAASGNVNYDAVLLAYGLCGNATVGLVANRFPLVIPRAHDCTTLFLGSRKAFKEHFGSNPSQAWTSIGYSERGDSIFSDGDTRSFSQGGQSFSELAEIYGEENARYLMDALTAHHDTRELPFIDIPETHIPVILERIKSRLNDEKKTLKTLSGSISIIAGLIEGNWTESEYLVLQPGDRISGVYDYDQVVSAETDSENA